MARWDRVVLHADMDAFYAAVEQLDDPSLRGKPILVGPPSGRGVVLTASYEARPFGVGSAMPMSRARRRCPDAVVVPPRFRRYVEISKRVMGVFGDFSPRVEALSLDEAFLDMTGAERIFGPPDAMGRALKAAVRQVTGGLTVSVGASGTKYVAKVASDFAKPDGLTVVPPDEARSFLAPLPISRLWGAGPKTTARFEALGLRTIGEVAAADPDWLTRQLGSAGAHFHRLARAVDPRGVRGGYARKSVGSDRTLQQDVSSVEEVQLHLRRSADAIGRRLRDKGIVARGVRVRLKTASFQLLSRQRRLRSPTDVGARLYEQGAGLLERFPWDEPFRLVGMAAYDLAPRDGPGQLELFAAAAAGAAAGTDATAPADRRIEVALDRIRKRFGPGAAHRAEDLERPAGMRLAPNLDFLE